MKFITVIALLVANCVIANATPAWDHVSIEFSNTDVDSASYNNVVGFTDDLSLAAELNVEPDCIKTVNSGAATVQTQLYEQGCALITFSGGVITRDFKFNCCGESAFIRINLKDWHDLKKQAKLDGLRFQQITKEGNTYSINFYKVVDKQSAGISPEQFLP